MNNGVVYALSTSGNVFGVSAATGTKVWSGTVGQATNGPVLSGIAVGGGLLVVPAGSTLTAQGLGGGSTPRSAASAAAR